MFVLLFLLIGCMPKISKTANPNILLMEDFSGSGRHVHEYQKACARELGVPPSRIVFFETEGGIGCGYIPRTCFACPE